MVDPWLGVRYAPYAGNPLIAKMDICAHFAISHMIEVSPICLYIKDKINDEQVEICVPDRYLRFDCPSCEVVVVIDTVTCEITRERCRQHRA